MRRRPRRELAAIVQVKVLSVDRPLGEHAHRSEREGRSRQIDAEVLAHWHVVVAWLCIADGVGPRGARVRAEQEEARVGAREVVEDAVDAREAVVLRRVSAALQEVRYGICSEI